MVDRRGLVFSAEITRAAWPIRCTTFMMGLPQLLVVDLDGTFLGATGEIDPANVDAVARARAEGIEVVIATGRSWLESRHVLAALGDHAAEQALFIGAGGATLQESATGRMVRRRTVDAHLVEAVIESLLRHGHLAHLLQDAGETGHDYVLVGEAGLDPASEWWFRTFPVSVRRHRTIDEARPVGATIRVGTVAVGTELEVVARSLREDLEDRVMLQHWSALTEHHVTGAATHLLECFAPETNKWTMTRELCAVRGYDLRRVAAVGDGLNDVQLIGEAAFGIAMGNADPRVAAVAKAQVARHDEGGFAEAVDLLLRRR